MGLTGVTGSEINRRRLSQIGWDTHVGVCANAPELKRMRRARPSFGERIDDLMIRFHFRTIRIQDPFDSRWMFRYPRIDLREGGNMHFDLAFYRASNPVRIFLRRKILDIDDNLCPAGH